jgi:hypothetical protein
MVCGSKPIPKERRLQSAVFAEHISLTRFTSVGFVISAILSNNVRKDLRVTRNRLIGKPTVLFALAEIHEAEWFGHES